MNNDVRVIIGVPSWCEAPGITAHARRIDDALDAAGFGSGAVIVNADNRSPDNTAGLFMATPTRHRKVTLPTARGKGNNEAALLDFALRSGADLFITLDADLKALPADWLPAFAGPVLEGRADLVTPLYPRSWHDGLLTNQIVAPLVLAFTGVPVRQPIGGDFALSPAAMRELSTRRWPAAAQGFGWDVYVLLTVLRLGLKVYQARLSHGKMHSRRVGSTEQIELDMEIKFAEVVRTSLEELATFAVDDVPLTGRYPPAPPLGEEPATYDFGPGKELTKRWWSRQRYSPWLDALLPPGASSDYPIQEGISDLLWARVLGRGASLARGEPPGRDFYHTLQALFLLRLVHVLPEYQKSCTSEIDAAVYRLGVLLRRQLQEELH